MTWTTEKPTKAGWYWWRRGTFLFVRHVQGHVDEQLWADGYTVEKLTESNAQWAGPLEPPLDGRDERRPGKMRLVYNKATKRIEKVSTVDGIVVESFDPPIECDYYAGPLEPPT